MKQLTTLHIFKVSLLALVFILASCEQEPVTPIETADAHTKASPASQQGELTIAEIVSAAATAEENPQFTLLLAALEYTGLTSTFTGGDNYTVFAPTDEAFLALLGGDPANLQTLDKDIVTNILQYHVTDGRRFSNSVLGKKNPKEIEMLNGDKIYVNDMGGIDTNDENTEVDANIILPADDDDPKLYDIPATNGVIHVIDAVILPTE
ncbi:fasciclin domain-containing protein [Gramella sp. BOM4]|nr:fasciclin domain-containing protein [Christiangramia bathymodioli]